MVHTNKTAIYRHAVVETPNIFMKSAGILVRLR